MSKKELLAQNIQLFDKLAAAKERVSALEKQLVEREDEIIALKNEKERLEAKLNATPPLKALEAKVEKQAYVSPEVEYGAAVIGKIVQRTGSEIVFRFLRETHVAHGHRPGHGHFHIVRRMTDAVV